MIRDTSSGRLFALKKVIIMTGQEGVQAAMREIEAYRRFRHPNIIKLFDSAVVQDESADGKIIYMCAAAAAIAVAQAGSMAPVQSRPFTDGHTGSFLTTPTATCKTSWRRYR